ncbi:hypothetical protein CCR75_004335 [Bremia lactucae]|uniref:Uncharacterized protein n=1 Tax=Bremia lactucae TaxID=4779 RepID=A0A976FLA8_BRELC|nr:hypothetical protein CCR75_004335 [Bremia lactucae]
MARGNSATTYLPVSTHTTIDEAKLALHAQDEFEYVTAYNYGAYSNGKVFRCISHEACSRRLRIVEKVKDEAEIPVTFQLAVAGKHGARMTNRKRKGIDLSIKGEVDGLLTKGVSLKKCRLSLQVKYADQPALLSKIPDVHKLKNRLLTLKKNGWEIPKATNTMTPNTVGCVKSAELDNSSDSETELSSLVEDDTHNYHPDEDSHSRLGIEVGNEFDKNKLMKEFAAVPGRPVFWCIVKRTDFLSNKSDEIVTEWITGQVTGWQARNNEPIKWMVLFTDGEKRPYELEELVSEIREAAQLGLNVTGRNCIL